MIFLFVHVYDGPNFENEISIEALVDRYLHRDYPIEIFKTLLNPYPNLPFPLTFTISLLVYLLITLY